MSAEARWERIASLLFWTGWLFAALTLYSVYEHESFWGLVMNAAVTGGLFGLWYLARARAEYLISGIKPPLPVSIASAAILCAGLGLVGVSVYQRHQYELAMMQPQVVEIDGAKYDVVEVPMADGKTIRSLSRVRDDSDRPSR